MKRAIREGISIDPDRRTPTRAAIRAAREHHVTLI
jgi:hypothetical protein